jgi:uncharacterized protein YfaP (DUF2135 family)
LPQTLLHSIPLQSEFVRGVPVDLRIVMVWDTDQTDVDLVGCAV